VAQLHDLHPQPSSDPCPPLPLNAPDISLDTELVYKVIKDRSDRGSAPGLSGWTEALLLPIIDDDDLGDPLIQLLSDIAQGWLLDDSRSLLLRSCLIPVKKRTGGVRPVVVGEAFVRVAALCMLRTRIQESFGTLWPLFSWVLGLKVE